MAIDNYFTLTTKLFHNYVEDQYPTSSNQFQHRLIHDNSTSNQQEIYLLNSSNPNEKVLLFTYNITSIGQTKQFLINIIYSHNDDGNESSTNNTIENILINWSEINLATLVFPIDELNLSQDLINAFNFKIKSVISNQRFKSLIEEFSASSNANANANILHHQLSRSPQNQPDDLLLPSIPPIPSLADTSAKRSSSSSTRPSDMPGFDDEYEINAPGHGHPTNVFPSIGDHDLNPPGLPKNPQLNPYLDPLRVGGSSNTGRGEGGMYPTANHPIFGGPQTSGNSSRLGVPPGARYDDPYGEDNLDALGSGLPGNLRLGSNHSSGGSGFPGFGGPPGGGGFQF